MCLVEEQTYLTAKFWPAKLVFSEQMNQHVFSTCYVTSLYINYVHFMSLYDGKITQKECLMCFTLLCGCSGYVSELV